VLLSGTLLVVLWLRWNYESMTFRELDLNVANGRLGCGEIMGILLEIIAEGLIDPEGGRVLGNSGF
jgi:hypothetical protein